VTKVLGFCRRFSNPSVYFRLQGRHVLKPIIMFGKSERRVQKASKFSRFSWWTKTVRWSITEALHVLRHWHVGCNDQLWNYFRKLWPTSRKWSTAISFRLHIFGDLVLKQQSFENRTVGEGKICNCMEKIETNITSTKLYIFYQQNYKIINADADQWRKLSEWTFLQNNFDIPAEEK